MNSTDTVPAREVCRRYGFTDRTLRNYVSAGLPVAAVRPDGTKLYAVADVDLFLRRLDSTRRRKWRPKAAAAPAAPKRTTKARRKAPPALSAPPAGDPQRDRPVDPDAISPAHLVKSSAEELLDLQKRLGTAERACYGKWAAAMAALKAGAAEYTPAEVQMLHRSWRDSQEMVRRFEIALPEILYRKGRFVDTTDVGLLLARAGAIVASELDQVGMAVAEKCVGLTARQIRDIVDDAIQRARAALVQEIRRLADTPQPKR